VSWLVLGLLGGVVGLDATSFPQAMWSRPLVAGTAAGLVLGRPASGLLIGALVEVFSLLILPFGAARYPESGTAAAAAAAAYCSLDPATADARMLLLTVVFALGWEHIAGVSVIFVRRLNARLVARPGAEQVTAERVTRRHLLAMSIDFLRGAWAVLVGAALGIMLLRALAAVPPAGERFLGVALIIALAAMLGAALTLFGGLRQRWLSLGLGLLCGWVLLLLI
jgi:PTS system mannose-specific IIC component